MCAPCELDDDDARNDQMQGLMSNTYNVDDAIKMYDQIRASDNVQQITTSTNDEPRIVVDTKETKGVKAGLRQGKQKMTELQFHKKHGHIGYCEGCTVCKMAKGAMRRITKKTDPPRPHLRAHTWTMDMVTFSDRSIEGCKYMLQMRDMMSGAYEAIPLYLKSDAPQAIRDWIVTNRNKSHYRNMGYQFCELIITDEPGEWSR